MQVISASLTCFQAVKLASFPFTPATFVKPARPTTRHILDVHTMADPDPSASRPFRVIIVGAGVVGLALSHALEIAGIDHVVLEKHHNIVSIKGSGLIIWPNGARILDQFGILQTISPAGLSVVNDYRRWPDGSIQYPGGASSTSTEMCAQIT